MDSTENQCEHDKRDGTMWRDHLGNDAVARYEAFRNLIMLLKENQLDDELFGLLLSTN